VFEQTYQKADLTGNTAIEYEERTKRILLRTHLRPAAGQWYSMLSADTKKSWPLLRDHFLTTFEKKVDHKAEKAALLQQIANLAQGATESITEYLARAKQLALRSPENRDALGINVLRGMRDNAMRDQVSFQFRLSKEFEIEAVIDVIKAAYGTSMGNSVFDKEMSPYGGAEYGSMPMDRDLIPQLFRQCQHSPTTGKSDQPCMPCPR
jgi:Retrotransposon gag protein